MHNHFAWYYFNQFLESGSKNLDYGLPLNGTFVELLLTMLDGPGKEFRKKVALNPQQMALDDHLRRWEDFPTEIYFIFFLSHFVMILTE